MVGVRLSEPERRSAIVRAAHRIAVRDGLAMVSGRSVAAEAELSSGRFAALHGLDSRSITDATLAAIQGAGVELVRHPQRYDAERIIAGLRDMPLLSAEDCCR